MWHMTIFTAFVRYKAIIFVLCNLLKPLRSTNQNAIFPSPIQIVPIFQGPIQVIFFP